MSNRGGKRENSGRSAGTNIYKEPTTPIRVPRSKVALIKDYLIKSVNSDQSAIDIQRLMSPAKKVDLPLYSSKISAGFPSPCDDHVEKRLNIHDYLVDQEEATFMVTIVGLSMRDAGLLPKDIAVVNRAVNAAVGDIIVAIVDGEFTIKQLALSEQGNPMLVPANPDFNAIEIKEGMDFEIWGVVTGSIRKYSR
jgi:DNA polymerase V